MSKPRSEGVPVLIMNPAKDPNMATRRKAPARRRAPARRAAPKANPRRRRRRATPRRRTTTRRRRRNPSFDVKGTAMALGGGAALGAAAYALQGQDFIENPKYKAAAVLGGGVLLGLAISGYSKAAGAGVAGAGAGIGVLQLLSIYMAEQAQTDGLGRIPAYAVNRFGIPGNAYHHLPSAAGYPAMGAVQADLGAVQADLSAIEMTLAGY